MSWLMKLKKENRRQTNNKQQQNQKTLEFIQAGSRKTPFLSPVAEWPRILPGLDRPPYKHLLGRMAFPFCSLPLLWDPNCGL